jgi:hypothetical protein
MGALRYPLDAASPEEMGRQFLRDHAGQLGLQSADGEDLHLHAVREGLSGTTVRFRQVIEGVPVYGSEIAVTYNHDGEARTVSSTYKPAASLVSSTGGLDAVQAGQIALAYMSGDLKAEDLVGFAKSQDLVIDVEAGKSRLAHRVQFEAPTPLAGWEILVDASSGEVLRAVDRNYYATGSGLAFLPDPLSSATVAYGTAGYDDGLDADTAELTAESFTVTLLEITDTAGTFSLVGPWAEEVDWDSPFNGLFSQNSSTWTATREDDAFEAVNTYYHIDTYMRYLNITLGLNIRPFQYPGGVQFDPSGFNGADNSSYSGGTGRLRFGEGGVDDAEDADVVIHELGHGLHDWVTSGSLSQNQGLSEGVGDYTATSYSRSFAGQWTPADPAYNWVFSWDGHNPFWNGRVTDWNDTNVYPDDLGGSIHTNGQFWASCNIDIHEVLGATKTDTAHWEGLARTGGGTNLEEAAQAALDAAFDLGYSSGDLTIMADIYLGCGFNVTVDLGDIFADGFESGGTMLWSNTVP